MSGQVRAERLQQGRGEAFEQSFGTSRSHTPERVARQAYSQPSQSSLVSPHVLGDDPPTQTWTPHRDRAKQDEPVQQVLDPLDPV